MLVGAIAGPIANRPHALSCIKLALNGGDIVWTGRGCFVMRRFAALKALFTALAFRRAEGRMTSRLGSKYL